MIKPLGSKGFTLIEILVVVTLILIIAGIAIPRFSGVSDEGKKAKASAELKTIQAALESYLIKGSGTLPAATAGNVSDLGAALEAASPRLVGEMDNFIDPFTTATPYLYVIDTGSKYYVIHSIGINKTDNITSISTAGVVTPTPSTVDDVIVTNGNV